MRSGLLFFLLLASHAVHCQAVRYGVIIDEIMADPSPTRGLPDAEWLELKNVSTTPVNLRGWKLTDASVTATINTSVVLQPDSFALLCSASAAPLLSGLGRVVVVSGFPSLSNEGEWIALLAPNGQTIHAVAYSKDWYRNDAAQEGGWSLEMIDPAQPCGGAGNWSASRDVRGGTPGKVNSVNALNPDRSPPHLLGAYATDSVSLLLQFSEPVDSAAAAGQAQYRIGPGPEPPARVVVMAPLFYEVKLLLNRPLPLGIPMVLSVHGMKDCAGNAFTGEDSLKTGWAKPANAKEAVFNEILFNPPADGTDYIELFNRSNTLLDLGELHLANRSAGGPLTNLHPVSPVPRLLLPGEYAVITPDVAAVQRHYPVRTPGSLVETGLPSMPDDKGRIVLLGSSGVVVDELQYDARWQFALLDNPEGVALERIDPDGPTQDPSNWHSAASTAGWGTPGALNSQHRAGRSAPAATWTVTPQLFSPDNDGFDDFATLYYRFPDPGWVCNITVYNASGIPVRWLVRNALCSAAGSFRWDGLDEKGQRLPMGVYVLLIEGFNLRGQTDHTKKALTLARRLK